VERHLKDLKLSNKTTLEFLEAVPYEKEQLTEDSNGDKNQSPNLAIYDSCQDSVS
jgi:hypothetical protein